MIKYSYWIVTEFWVLTNGVDEDMQNLPMAPCMAPASADGSWRSNSRVGGMGVTPGDLGGQGFVSFMSKDPFYKVSTLRRWDLGCVYY